jgi:hypothetical protein
LLARHGERADGVQEHVDLNTGAAARRERRRDFLGGLAVLEDVLRIVDRSPGAPDHRQLGREDPLAVEQDVHAVARDHRSSRVSAERRRERGLPRLEMRQLEVRRHARAADEDDEQGGEAALDAHDVSPSMVGSGSGAGESKRDTIRRGA